MNWDVQRQKGLILYDNVCVYVIIVTGVTGVGDCDYRDVEMINQRIILIPGDGDGWQNFLPSPSSQLETSGWVSCPAPDKQASHVSPHHKGEGGGRRLPGEWLGAGDIPEHRPSQDTEGDVLLSGGSAGVQVSRVYTSDCHFVLYILHAGQRSNWFNWSFCWLLSFISKGGDH